MIDKEYTLAETNYMHPLIIQFKVSKIMHSNSCPLVMQALRDMFAIVMNIYYRLFNETNWKFRQKTQSETEPLKTPRSCL